MPEHSVFVSFVHDGRPGQIYGHRVLTVTGDDPWSAEAVEVVQRALEELKGTNIVLLSYQPLACPHCSGSTDA